MCMVAHARMDYGQRALGKAAAASCRTQEELQSSACHSEPSLGDESQHRSQETSSLVIDPAHAWVSPSSNADVRITGQKRSRDDEPQSVVEGSTATANKRSRAAGRRVQFASESRMKLIPRISDLLAESAAADAAALPGDDSMETEELDVLLCGVVEEGSVSSFEIPTTDDDDELMVKTKDVDGPSPENVATQALVAGLVERKLRNASSIVDALRATIKKAQQPLTPTLEDQPAGACDDAQPGAKPHGPSFPANSRARSEQEVFELVVSRMQLLIERIESRGRATLLPSTATIGPPFVPALKFLQRAIRSCAPRLPASSSLAPSPLAPSPALVAV
mmetsp:Transcript_19946/g.47492  ORF Transcript_19946/g.47492 Transcript_19946/m.47492 type:complete len:335 (+) Transcript_19946:227-1231(+)